MNNDEWRIRNGTRERRQRMYDESRRILYPPPSLFYTADDVKAKRACTCMSCLVIVVTVTVFMHFLLFLFPFRFVSGFAHGLQKWAWEIARREGNALSLGASSSLASYNNNIQENIYKPQRGRKRTVKKNAKEMRICGTHTCGTCEKWNKRAHCAAMLSTLSLTGTWKQLEKARKLM